MGDQRAVKMTRQGVRDLGYGKPVSRKPAEMPPEVAKQINQERCRHFFVSTADPFLEQCVHCQKYAEPKW